MLWGPYESTPQFFPCTRHQNKFIRSSCIVRRITIRKKIVPKRISINVEKDENQRLGSGWTPKKRTRVNHTSKLFSVDVDAEISNFFNFGI